MRSGQNVLLRLKVACQAVLLIKLLVSLFLAIHSPMT
jgi:hypothetical protein